MATRRTPKEAYAAREAKLDEVRERLDGQVGAVHGMDASAYTIPYVSGWAMAADGKNPVQIGQATAEQVRKVAVEVLDRLDTVQISDRTPLGFAPATAARAPEGKQTRSRPSPSRPARAAEPQRTFTSRRGS